MEPSRLINRCAVDRLSGGRKKKLRLTGQQTGRTNRQASRSKKEKKKKGTPSLSLTPPPSTTSLLPQVCFTVMQGELHVTDAMDGERIIACDAADVEAVAVFTEAPNVSCVFLPTRRACRPAQPWHSVLNFPTFNTIPQTICIVHHNPDDLILTAVRLQCDADAQAALKAAQSAVQDASWARRQRTKVEERISKRQQSKNRLAAASPTRPISPAGGGGALRRAPPACPTTPERPAAQAAAAAVVPPSPGRLEPMFVDDVCESTQPSRPPIVCSAPHAPLFSPNPSTPTPPTFQSQTLRPPDATYQ